MKKGLFISVYAFVLVFLLHSVLSVIRTSSAQSTSQLNLSWNDNSDNETGFKIERKIDSEGNYSQIGTVGADVTSYLDTGLNTSTTYYYRVRAYNSYGNSGYSNEASATTAAETPPIDDGSSSTSSGGGCFIATAAYESPMEPQLRLLRDFRDCFLLSNIIGSCFVDFYYRYSPPVADFIAKRDTLRTLVRCSLLPAVGVSYVAWHMGLMPAMALMMVLLMLLGIPFAVVIRRLLRVRQS